MLVHRELSNAFVSTISIYKNRIDIKNANKPIHAGIIKKPEISPFPKNHSIAKVFRTLGIIDELGSGMNKIFKYGKIYFNSEPIIENGELFKVSFLKNIDENKEIIFKIENVPQNAFTNKENAPQSKKSEIEQRRKKILKILYTNQFTKRVELSELLGVSIDTIKRDLSYLKAEGIVEYIGGAKNGKWVVEKNALPKEENAPIRAKNAPQNKKSEI